MSRNLDRQFNIKIPPSYEERIRVISEKFALPKSEVVRRSLFEGIRSFEDARIPGSPREKEKGA
jgi:predicted DNA-binding protein